MANSTALEWKGVNFPRGQAQRHHPRAASVLNQQVEDVILVVKVHIVLDALLVAGLKDHVPGAVRGVAGAPHGRFAEFLGVPAEGPLGDFPVGRAAEGQAPVFEIVNGLDRFPAEDLHGILVSQVIAALDRVEHVPFPMVFFHVAEGGANAALRRSRVRARGIELAQHRHVALPGQLQRGHQARATRSHYHCVIPLDHVIKPQKKLSSRQL